MLDFVGFLPFNRLDFFLPLFNLHVGGCLWGNPSNFAHLTPGRMISLLLGVQTRCFDKANPAEGRGQNWLLTKPLQKNLGAILYCWLQQ
jgi:hypothetical protein